MKALIVEALVEGSVTQQAIGRLTLQTTGQGFTEITDAVARSTRTPLPRARAAPRSSTVVLPMPAAPSMTTSRPAPRTAPLTAAWSASASGARSRIFLTARARPRRAPRTGPA